MIWLIAWAVGAFLTWAIVAGGTWRRDDEQA